MSDPNKTPENGGTPESEDNSALKKALDMERQARKELERQIKAKDEADAKAKADAEKAQLEAKGDYEKLKASIEAEKAALAKERDDATAGLRSYLLKAELTTAIAANKGNPHLLKLVQDQFEVMVSPDGSHKVLVKGDATKTPSQYIEALKKDASYGAFFEASGASGSGSGQSVGNTGGKAWKDMSLDEQTTLYRTNPTQAKALQTGA